MIRIKENQVDNKIFAAQEDYVGLHAIDDDRS